MLTENQQKWLAALRSGEYRQGQCGLRRGDSYCCLGVAAELFKTERTVVDTYSAWDADLIYLYDDNNTTAPDYVIKALNLRGSFGDRAGSLSGVEYFDSLAQLNDTGKTFAEIADIFEAKIEEFTK